MAGYAYPVGTANTDTGTANSITVPISVANSDNLLYTATQKTRVNSVLASNTLGTILPVDLLVYRADNETTHFVVKSRVLKSKYLVLPLVSGDSRVAETAVDANANKISVELVLEVGDQLYANCPIAAAINITASMTEGIK